MLTPEQNKNNRRFKNLLINPKYQAKYIFWISGTGIALIVLYSVLFYRYIDENYAILVQLSPMGDEVKQQLYSELHQILLRLAIISSGFIALVSFIGLLISHRTAGPMFHFMRIFEKIQSGDLKARIHLRPGDDFRDVAQTFNEMMDKVTSSPKS